jgi:hypothetical protein
MTQGFACYAERVRATMGQVTTLGQIEKEMHAWPLSEEECSALWLLAWTMASERVQRENRKAQAFYLT